MNTRKAKRITIGFTLIELIVVMVILVLLAGTVTVMYIKQAGKGKTTRAQVDVKSLETACDTYKLAVGDYPADLESLVTKPSEATGWDGPYIKGGKVPMDPWGRPFEYRVPGEHNADGFDLWSLGKDGKDGGEGEDADITNWSE